MRPDQLPMLHLAHNNSRRYADRDGKSDHIPEPASHRHQFVLSVGRDQHAGREGVSLSLFLTRLCGFTINECGPNTMQEKVGYLVEEAEPKLIVREVAEAQDEHRLSRRKKPGCTARSAASRCAEEHDGYSNLRTQRTQTGDEVIEIGSLR